MSEILSATTSGLLDIAAREECAGWQIAVWPGPTQVLASDAGTVATSEAPVLWQTLRGVRASGSQVTITTDYNMYRAAGNDSFVIRPAVTS